MKKKVGIVSCFWMKNYGSALQAYATQYYLERLGCETKTLNYKGQLHGLEKVSFRFNCMRLKSMWHNKIIALNKQSKIRSNSQLTENVAKRNAKFDDFVSKHFKLTRQYNDKKEISSDVVKYDGVILGSDQLWLPVNVLLDYYTLRFVPEDIRKIAYATSFGISSIPSFLQKKYADFLRRLDYISVREEVGRTLVKDIIDREVPVVCDPTLMLDANDWMTIQEEKPLIEAPYLFCYFLGNNPTHREFAIQVKQKYGYKIVSLLHMDEYIPTDEKYVDYALYDVGPAEFLNLIRNAKIVLTDSFHGSIFSILHHKIFYVFNRFAKTSSQSRNSRIDSLLSITGLDNRRLEGTETIASIFHEEIDYTDCDSAIEKLRETTRNYLEKALND